MIKVHVQGLDTSVEHPVHSTPLDSYLLGEMSVLEKIHRHGRIPVGTGDWYPQQYLGVAPWFLFGSGLHWTAWWHPAFAGGSPTALASDTKPGRFWVLSVEGFLVPYTQACSSLCVQLPASPGLTCYFVSQPGIGANVFNNRTELNQTKLSKKHRK